MEETLINSCDHYSKAHEFMEYHQLVTIPDNTKKALKNAINIVCGSYY